MKLQAKSKSKLHIKNKREMIIKKGYKYLSTPYRLGAKPFQTDEFDCSSFVQYLHSHFCIPLPRTSRQQSLLGKKVEKKELQRGDLLFFTNRWRYRRKGTKRVAHIAIYLGNNKMLHSCKEEGVTVSKLTEIINESKSKRWIDYYLFARRIPDCVEDKMGITKK
ncbi:C40 family peptidase [Virgibacillus sp. LDC1]|uniref:C40 family peptidase n=1 Tax=Paenibacillus TaxID=44249 RepID=UPI000C27E459|nr:MULTISPECIES: C40 family peptidase [Paenibacillus]MCV4234527.1 C40 family peptidase [Virgibacillus sp. LDC1]MDL1162947.1 C40 family peptidase [Yersinia pestis]MEC0259701.1 C40 family peptidase [Paenibacillus lautus]MEC0305663.1 C40 family peptidase [Paenibacillus lautus]